MVHALRDAISGHALPHSSSGGAGGVGLYANVNHWRNINQPAALAHNDYAANAGDQTTQHGGGPADYAHHTGMAYLGSLVKAANIKDGLTSTYLVAGEIAQPRCVRQRHVSW